MSDKEKWVVGCLECGAMGDIYPEDINTAECYGCGATNFMTDKQPNMELPFIERFFEARMKKMS